MIFDLDKAAKRESTEKSVESRAASYARGLGFFCAKVNFPHVNGAADRMFLKLIDNRLVLFFIEFKKAEVGIIAKLQAYFRRTMAKHGVSVYFCDTVEDAKEIIDYEINQAKLNAKPPRL